MMGNIRAYPFHSSLTAPAVQPAESEGQCQLLGIFGWLVQLTLAALSIGSLVGKSAASLIVDSQKVLAGRDADLEGVPARHLEVACLFTFCSLPQHLFGYLA